MKTRREILKRNDILDMEMIEVVPLKEGCFNPEIPLEYEIWREGRIHCFGKNKKKISDRYEYMEGSRKGRNQEKGEYSEEE